MACIPATVRLELVGDGRRGGGDPLPHHHRRAGLPRRGAGTTFALWQGDDPVDEQPRRARRGHRAPRLVGQRAGGGLPPEGMRPTVLSVTGVGGDVTPAGPRWVAYGDSILEGWVASGPARPGRRWRPARSGSTS